MLFAGLTPGAVGLTQINIELPASFPAGSDLKLGIRFGGESGTYVLVALPVAR